MRQRYDKTYLAMFRVADCILLDGVNTSRSMVPDREIEFSARYITVWRLLSAPAIFFCPGIYWITEMSPDSGGISELGYSGTQSVVHAFMDGSDCGIEVERIDGECQW